METDLTNIEEFIETLASNSEYIDEVHVETDNIEVGTFNFVFILTVRGDSFDHVEVRPQETFSEGGCGQGLKDAAKQMQDVAAFASEVENEYAELESACEDE